MEFTEQQKDLFSVDTDKYVLAHCISSDCRMGAGIAIQFAKKYPGIKTYCKNQNPLLGQAIYYIDNKGTKIYNLITKACYYQKPTYKDLIVAINNLKIHMTEQGQKYLAIPLLGCGLDRLQWKKISVIIKEIFIDTDIEILVCIK